MLQASLLRLIFLTALGSCLELFDFISFIFLSPILAKVFFPLQTGSQGLLYTFIIFFAGYFFRPIGGLILAHFGDRYGRKNIFILTLVLMSFPSLIIACLPSPQKLGWVAVFILALMRIAQGISLGGEVAGSITYVVEFVSSKWQTLACSVISSAANIGVILAALFIAALNQNLSLLDMQDFGWRLPFLIGALLGLLAFYLRKNFIETPVFLEIKKRRQLAKLPVLVVLKDHLLSVLFGSSLTLIVANATSTFHLFFPTYLRHYLHYETQQVFFISSAGISILAFTSPLFALVSNYIGRNKQALIGSFALFLTTLMGIYYFKLEKLGEIYLLIILISLTIAAINSVMMAILAELFHPAIRFSGVALTYNAGCLLGAGLTPALNTYLIGTTGYLNTPFVLVAGCALLTSLVILGFSKAAMKTQSPSAISYQTP